MGPPKVFDPGGLPGNFKFHSTIVS